VDARRARTLRAVSVVLGARKSGPALNGVRPQYRNETAVLGVDLASARWADVGTALVWCDVGAGDVRAIARVATGVTEWPADARAPVSADALADAIHACAVREGVAAVALDGPHAWRDPARGEDGPGVGRLAEFAVRAQCKTGVYPRTFPGTQQAWTRLSIAVFDALLAREGVRMATPDDTRRADDARATRTTRAGAMSAGAGEGASRAGAGYLLLESFPTAIWRASGLTPLPAKSRRPDVAAFYARLADAFALPAADVTSHDDLQALVAALAAVGVAGGPVDARAHGAPHREVPHADGTHRVEGWIWGARPLVPREKSGPAQNGV
jgi:hypothetical protein